MHKSMQLHIVQTPLALGEIAGESKKWCDELWEELVMDSELLEVLPLVI